MSLQQTGRIEQIGQTEQVSEKFKKREFTLLITEEINGNLYSNYGKFQLVQNKCDIIDRFQFGQEVKVSFNIKGNRWERDGKVNYITNLDAWKIEVVGATQQQPQSNPAPQQFASSAKNEGIPVYSSSHTTNGGSGYASPAPDQIDDLPF